MSNLKQANRKESPFEISIKLLLIKEHKLLNKQCEFNKNNFINIVRVVFENKSKT